MMVTKPRFSILLPTYNRCDLLPLAIESVLDQTFPDFELIISNGGSDDKTEELLSRYSDSRIRTFNSPQRLLMPENYEFALQAAVGEYIIFFSDDDAFVPSMLERVNDCLKATNSDMIAFPFAQYHHADDFVNNVRANTLTYSPFSGNTVSVQSTDDLDRMSGRFFLSPQPPDSLSTRPLIGNVVLRRAITDRIREKVEHVFATIPVDGYFITLVLGTLNQYLILDQPLLVWSQWEKNASISSGKGLRQHYERLLAGKTLEKVPLKFALPVNCAANSILQANEDIGGRPTLSLDWRWYYLKMNEYLYALDANGIDTTLERKELELKLDETPEYREFVFQHTSKVRPLKNWVKKHVGPFFSVLCHGRDRYFGAEIKKCVVLSGEKEGFENFLDSARSLEQKLH